MDGDDRRNREPAAQRPGDPNRRQDVLEKHRPDAGVRNDLTALDNNNYYNKS